MYFTEQNILEISNDLHMFTSTDVGTFEKYIPLDALKSHFKGLIQS